MFKIRKIAEKNRAGSILFILLLISVILLAVSGRRISFKPKEIGFSVISGFQKVFSETGNYFSRTINSIGELKKLRGEYNKLREELNEYQVLARDLAELKTENENLRELLTFSSEINYSPIPAQIIAKDPSNIFSSIVVNKGSRHGVEKDMPVIAYNEGFQGLVGKVIVVSPFSSQIKPIFDSTCYVASRLQNSRYEGLISGRGSDSENLLMQYVKKYARESIKYGDLVITSGMNSIYPKGIYIGRVRGIHAKEYEPSLELDVETIINFGKLEYVFILGTDE